MANIAKIEEKIDQNVSRSISVGSTGITFENAGQVMEFAKMMAVSGSAVPKHLRGEPGACLGVIDDAIRFGISPYALARKSFFVNDNLGYEAQVIAAVVNKNAPLRHRPDVSYTGEDSDRKCIVTGEFRSGAVRSYESPRIDDIRPKNSPLWKNDPDQQLSYYSLRAFARRHCPEVILGAYDREELEEFRGPDHAKDITPTAERLRAHKEAAEAKREGFDVDYVADEISTAMGETEIQEHTESDASATEGAADNAGEEAAASVDAPAYGEGDEGAAPHESPSPEDDAETDQPPAVDERFIYAVRQMLEAAGLDLPVKDRAAKIQELKQFWSTNLTEDSHAHLKTLYTSALAVANGKANAVAAKEFYADMLDCTPADLEPQA